MRRQPVLAAVVALQPRLLLAGIDVPRQNASRSHSTKTVLHSRSHGESRNVLPRQRGETERLPS